MTEAFKPADGNIMPLVDELVAIGQEAYRAANPLGGPASMLRAAAERIEAGEEYHAVLADYGLAHIDPFRKFAQRVLDGWPDCKHDTSALEQRQEPEPIAWRTAEQYSPDVGSWFEYYDEYRTIDDKTGLTPLYASPQAGNLSNQKPVMCVNPEWLKYGGSGEDMICESQIDGWTPLYTSPQSSTLTKAQAQQILDMALELEKTGRLVSLTEDAERYGYVTRNRNVQLALEDYLRNLTEAAPVEQRQEPAAFKVEGWYEGKLMAHILHFTVEEAKATASEFAKHYTTTHTIPLFPPPVGRRQDDYWEKEARRYAKNADYWRERCGTEADELLRNLGLDPGTYRTDGGAINHLKVKAALRHPGDYATPVEQRGRPACIVTWLGDGQGFHFALGTKAGEALMQQPIGSTLELFPASSAPVEQKP